VVEGQSTVAASQPALAPDSWPETELRHGRSQRGFKVL
jgi:hypothetical protein